MFTTYREEVKRAVPFERKTRLLPGEKKAAVDKYIIGHMAWGMILAAMGLPWWGALSMSVAFEILEQPAKKHIPFIFPEPIPDPLMNSVMDTSGVMIGWGIVRYAMKG